MSDSDMILYYRELLNAILGAEYLICGSSD